MIGINFVGTWLEDEQIERKKRKEKIILNNRVLRLPAIVLLTRRFDPETRILYIARKVSATSSRFSQTLLLNEEGFR